VTDQEGSGKKLRTSVKGPLVFSAVLGLIAAVITTVVATGGTGRDASNGQLRVVRFDLGLIAFGITFVVALVMCAMLAMSYKENADHLGKGSGVSLRSEDRLKKSVKPAPASSPVEPDLTEPAEPSESAAQAPGPEDKPRPEYS
jgi:hypothetical protein